MKTKYGNAKINNNGYYWITSSKEGNYRKLLHRLIATEYFGDWINDSKEPFDIHHIDGNKLNNCVLNLEPISPSEHMRLHHKCKNVSKETKKKISESKIDKPRSEETKKKISKTMNTTSYFRVTKQKNKTCKQGFRWMYQYYKNGKKKAISSIDIEKLEKKVKAKGLPWRKL